MSSLNAPPIIAGVTSLAISKWLTFVAAVLLLAPFTAEAISATALADTARVEWQWGVKIPLRDSGVSGQFLAPARQLLIPGHRAQNPGLVDNVDSWTPCIRERCIGVAELLRALNLGVRYHRSRQENINNDRAHSY